MKQLKADYPLPFYVHFSSTIHTGNTITLFQCSVTTPHHHHQYSFICCFKLVALYMRGSLVVHIHSGNAMHTFVHIIWQYGALTQMLLQSEQRKIKGKHTRWWLSQFERSIICHYEAALLFSRLPAPYLWHSYLYECHTFSSSSGLWKKQQLRRKAIWRGKTCVLCTVYLCKKTPWRVGGQYAGVFVGSGNGLLEQVKTEAAAASVRRHKIPKPHF